MKTTIKFEVEKETKGAIWYKEVGDDGVPKFSYIGTLYAGTLVVCKSAVLGGKIPQKLTITVEGE